MFLMTPRTLTNPLKLECKYQWNCKILNRIHVPGLVRPKSLYYNPRQIIYHTCKWLSFTLDEKPHFILILKTDVDRIFIILLEYPPLIFWDIEEVRLELRERYLGIQSCLLTFYWLPSFLRNVLLFRMPGKIKQIAPGNKAPDDVFASYLLGYIIPSCSWVLRLCCFISREKVHPNKHDA